MVGPWEGGVGGGDVWISGLTVVAFGYKLMTGNG